MILKKGLNMKEKANISPIGENWENYRKNHFTAEEIAENNLITELVGQMIQTRKEEHLSQRDLEAISGIKQSVIAKMESGKTDPHLSTVLKLLFSMGKTLTIVPLEAKVLPGKR